MPMTVAGVLIAVGIGEVTAAFLAPIIIGIAMSTVVGFVDQALPSKPKDSVP